MSGLVLALAAGAAIGALYFGSLWLVVRRLDRLARPGVWLGVTGILRLAGALALFLVVAQGRWDRLGAALVGFLAVRLLLTRWLGLPSGGPGRLAAGARPDTAGPG